MTPLAVEASGAVNIGISATGTGTAPITDFVVIRGDIDETSAAWVETTGTWTIPPTADYVIIIRRFDRYPEATDDGEVVYQGTGETFDETVTGENIEKIYYTAWTYGGGLWSCPIYYLLEVKPKMVNAIMLIAFIILALVPTIGAFALKSGRQILGFVAAGAWLLLGIWSYTQSTATWDINYALFWLSMGMVIACSLVAVILKEKKEEEAEEATEDWGDDQELMDDLKTDEQDRERLDRLFGRRKRKKHPRMSSFAKTGKEKRTR